MFIFFILMCSFSCSVNASTPVKDVNLRPQSGYVCQIRLKAAKKLREDYQLVPSGTGSQMMDKVKMIALSFDYRDLVDEVKARELLNAATSELTRCVNEDERIRPYLHDYPFTAKNVEIRIFVYKKNGYDVPLGEFVILSAIDGILTYKKDGATKAAPYVEVLRETYEEAIAKQKESREEV